MKKLLVTTAICLIGAASVMAQGRVAFANSTATATQLRINNGTISSEGVVQAGATTQILGTASTATFGIGPGSVRIELLAGTSSLNLSPVLVGAAGNLSFVTNSASLLAAAQGTFSGGNPLANAAWTGAQAIFFQARVWSINGTNPLITTDDNLLSYAARLASGSGFAGYTPVISVTPTISPTAAAALFGPSGWSGITIYNVEAIPEPSSMALAGLGAASLLIFRRRK